MIHALLLLAALYYAWTYSRAEVDPDWSMFNLWAFTGARYGRDFVDCKMPGIHLWYRTIAVFVGKDIRRVRFTHHLLISLPGVIQGGWPGLIYIVLVNSGWMLAFHGNVGAPAAAALFIAMWIDVPVVYAAVSITAIGFEPKMAVPLAVMSIFGGWFGYFLGAAAFCALAALLIRLFSKDIWGWLVEANITIPKRMTEMRNELLKSGKLMRFPYYTAQSLTYVAPWLSAAVISNPDWRYWAPLIVYFAIITLGIVVRPNHFIVIAPWLAWSGMPLLYAAALIAADWISAGFYIGDIWERFYRGLRDENIAARKVGEYLRNKPGLVWVNTYHSAINIYSGSPPLYGLAEQVEIAQNARERRQVWREKFKAHPPDWVVTGPMPGVAFNTSGYYPVEQIGSYKVYRKIAGKLQ